MQPLEATTFVRVGALGPHRAAHPPDGSDGPLTFSVVAGEANRISLLRSYFRSVLRVSGRPFANGRQRTSSPAA
ncbi:MAG: hypothetical protein HKL86_00660 [Acidimicrobiaceae bacterium]|nr:hypothetical protein [Acidimicrobiaceae bacterium]